MELALSGAEDNALRMLLAEATGDVILQLDCGGHVLSASASLAGCETNPVDMLFKPHLADLAHRDHRNEVRTFLEASLAGRDASNSIQFAMAGSELAPNSIQAPNLAWHELAVRRVRDDSGALQGAMGLLRSVEHIRSLQGELAQGTTTDALTGLANARSFRARIERLINSGGAGVVAFCEVEHFRALQLQYGVDVADEVIWAFARFLKTMAGSDEGLARIGPERFGFALQNCTVERARSWAHDVRTTLARLAMSNNAKSPSISTNIGIARISGSSERVMRKAELALLMARAGRGVKVAPVRPLAPRPDALGAMGIAR